MKITILTHGIAPETIGGSETQTLGLATELSKTNEVTVITRSKGEFVRVENSGGFLIKRLGKKHRWPFPVFSFVFAALSEIRKSRKNIEILFAKTIYNGLIAALAKKIFKIPAAVLIEGEQEYRDKNIFNQIVLRFVSRNSRLIVQTEKIQKELLKRCGSKSDVIPNGVNLCNEIAKGSSVIYIGRLIRNRTNDKGVRFLIDAVKDLDRDTLIIGDGPEKESLMRRSEGVGSIHFAGEVLPDRVRSYMIKGFVLVLPSIYGEGLPNVILEAMSVGLPVIATKIAGITDIIEHGITGFLVEPADSSEIRSYIDILKENKPIWDKMSRSCIRESKKYDWAVISKRFEDLFHRIIVP